MSLRYSSDYIVPKHRADSEKKHVKNLEDTHRTLIRHLRWTERVDAIVQSLRVRTEHLCPTGGSCCSLHMSLLPLEDDPVPQWAQEVYAESMRFRTEDQTHEKGDIYPVFDRTHDCLHDIRDELLMLSENFSIRVSEDDELFYFPCDMSSVPLPSFLSADTQEEMSSYLPPAQHRPK